MVVFRKPSIATEMAERPEHRPVSFHRTLASARVTLGND